MGKIDGFDTHEEAIKALISDVGALAQRTEDLLQMINILNKRIDETDKMLKSKPVLHLVP
jgi:uncharacterized protein YoxC